jgi:hypothetical protein
MVLYSVQGGDGLRMPGVMPGALFRGLLVTAVTVMVTHLKFPKT